MDWDEPSAVADAFLCARHVVAEFGDGTVWHGCGLRDARFAGAFPADAVQARLASVLPGHHWRIAYHADEPRPWWAVTMAARADDVAAPLPEPAEAAFLL